MVRDFKLMGSVFVGLLLVGVAQASESDETLEFNVGLNLTKCERKENNSTCLVDSRESKISIALDNCGEDEYMSGCSGRAELVEERYGIKFNIYVSVDKTTFKSDQSTRYNLGVTLMRDANPEDKISFVVSSGSGVKLRDTVSAGGKVFETTNDGKINYTPLVYIEPVR